MWQIIREKDVANYKTIHVTLKNNANKDQKRKNPYPLYYLNKWHDSLKSRD